MIEKFNFYDIYGYLIPGLALIGLLWLPFGLFLHSWPTQEIASAILVLLLAYVIGLLIQRLATFLIVSKVKDKSGRERYPADVLLDKSDEKLAEAIKKKIDELCKKYFSLEVSGDQDQSDEALKVTSPVRNGAFFQARSALIQNKKQSYMEQFEGLYALTRGICLSLAGASFYFLGWMGGFHVRGLSSQLPGLAGIFILVALIVTLHFAFVADVYRKRPGNESRPAQASESDSVDERSIATGLAISLAFVLFLAGFLSVFSLPEEKNPSSDKNACLACCPFLLPCLTGTKDSANDEKAASLKIEKPAFLMLLLALGAAAASVRFYGAYKSFIREFALNVWRDFANFEVSPPSEEKPVTNVSWTVR